jgi:hypothetical protein
MRKIRSIKLKLATKSKQSFFRAVKMKSIWKNQFLLASDSLKGKDRKCCLGKLMLIVVPAYVSTKESAEFTVILKVAPPLFRKLLFAWRIMHNDMLG